MATSIVNVYNTRYGQWQENAKALLGWNGLVSLGISKTVHINVNGKIIIEYK